MGKHKGGTVRDAAVLAGHTDHHCRGLSRRDIRIRTNHSPQTEWTRLEEFPHSQHTEVEGCFFLFSLFSLSLFQSLLLLLSYRMHFVVNEAGTEKLFVLDYSRPDNKDPGAALYGRIAFSSEERLKIFNKLKETMVALANAEQS